MTLAHARSAFQTLRLGATLALAVVLALAACGTSGREPAADSLAQGNAATTASAPIGAVPPCPMEGDWTPCAVEDRLVHAGVVIEKQPDSATHPFLHVPGVLYHVGSAEHQLEVFLYPSASARERDTALLDSATVSPRGTHVVWRTPPTLILSNNMAAVILSANDRTVERLALALGAGLPQPGKR